MKCFCKTVCTATLLLILLTVGSIYPAFGEESKIKVSVDGIPIIFEDQQPAFINDRTLVPMRKIFEELGATIKWDDANQTVIAKKGNIEIVLKIDDTSMSVNGTSKRIDQPATLIGGRTMVPVRFIGEALGADVSWDQNTQTVVIKSVAATAGNTGQKNDTQPAGTISKDLPAGGISVIPNDALFKVDPTKTKLVGETNGAASKVSAGGVPFESALKLTTKKVPEKYYGFQIKSLELGTIDQDDTALVVFYARTTDGGENGVGKLAVTIKDKNVAVGPTIFNPGGTWQRYCIPFKSPGLTESSELAISLGYMLQTVEIGGLDVLNYKDKVGIDALPKSSSATTAASQPAKASPTPTPATTTQTPAAISKDVPAGGASIIANGALFSQSPDVLKLVGAANGTKEKISVTGMPFDSALKITTQKVTAKYFDFQLKTFPTAAVNKDDAVLMVFYARTASGGSNGNGKLSLSIKGSEAYGPVVITPGNTWQKYCIPIKSPALTTTSEIVFSMGYVEQAIELGGLEVINYSNKITVDNLPKQLN